MLMESGHPSASMRSASSWQVMPAASSVRPSTATRIRRLSAVTPNAVRGLRLVQWLPMLLNVAVGTVPAFVSMGPFAMMSGWVTSFTHPPAGMGMMLAAPEAVTVIALFQLHAPLEGGFCGITVLLTRR